MDSKVIEKKKDFIREHLNAKDLSLEQQNLLNLLGIEKYIEICSELGGLTFTVNKLETLNRLSCKRKLLKNKDIYKDMFTAKQLAAMYGISESTVYNILRRP